jgi:hypothetical protein
LAGPLTKSGGFGGDSYDGVPAPKILSSTNPATHVLLAMIVQTGGIVIATVIAGVDDTVANLMILLMVGLLLLFMIMNYQKFAGIVDMLTNVEQGAA